MAIDFPTSPSDGDNFVSDNVTYIFSETKNIWYTKSNVNTVTLTTTNIGEGDNLYFTNSRVYANISPLLYTDEDAYANISPLLNTTTITEGDNLYFTNTRAIGALTAGESLEIASNGLVTVAVSEVDLGSVSQNIIPSTNEVYSLGSSDNRWKDLFLSGNTIVLGDVAIKAHNGSIATSRVVRGNGYIVPEIIEVGAGGSYDEAANSTGYFGLPVGTTEERPESPQVGMVRFNSTSDGMEFYTANTGWLVLQSLGITQVSPTSFSGNSGTQFTITGSGFESGCQVYFTTNDGTEVLAGTVAISSLTQIIATTPRNFLVSEEPLGITVRNPQGFSASVVGLIDTGSVPVWTTNTGSIGNVVDGVFSTLSLSASDPDSQSITYTISTGTLPEGLVITSSNGTISGTPDSNNYNASGVTYNFTVTAQDSSGNETARTFNILKTWYDGSSEALAAPSIAALQNIGFTDNGAYWLQIPTIGARRLWCDLTEGWILLLRGYGPNAYGYGNAAWTNTTAYSPDNLLTNSNGSWAKTDAFYYLTGLNQIKLYAGGFSGNGATGAYQNFIFSFAGTGSARELMFTTANQMSWDSTYSQWRSVFGHDRTSSPKFERYGSTANQTVAGQGAGRVGCGQPLMFGFNASDGGSNDTNSGLGTHPSYCGGDGIFAGGGYMGTGGYARIYGRFNS